MRNIRIADRSEWISQRPPAPPRRKPRTLGDVLATIPVLLLVPALVLVIAPASAGGPQLDASPSLVAPGAKLVIRGSGFAPKEAGVIVLDRAVDAVATYRVNGNGSFRASFTLPSGMAPGRHSVDAVIEEGSETVLRASTELLVEDATVEPSPEPSAEPSPAPSVAAVPSVEPLVAPAPSVTPAPSASAEPTSVPSTEPSEAPTAPTPTPTPRPTATPTATPRPTATPAPTPTPTPTLAPPPSRPASSYLLLSPSEIRALPMSGAAWSALLSRAGSSVGTPDLSDQDEAADIIVLAKALVWARTNEPAYRSAVVTALRSVVGTEAGGRTLALGRNLPGYVIAADLVDLASADPGFDADTFRPWLRSLLSKNLDGLTLSSTHETRPNNWGTHAGAARAAIARYLRDGTVLARTATVFRGWLGDRSAWAGFSWGDTSWQCDPARPVGINPAGCVRDGHSLDGVLPDDQRRGGSYTWPAPKENYVWEALQGAVLQAELLYQGGHAAWGWEDSALRRAVRWLVETNGYPAEGDDTWIPWLVDARYGTAYHGSPPSRTGKNFGFTDWLYR